MFRKALNLELYRLSRSPMLYISIFIGVVLCGWLYIVQLQDLQIHQDLIVQFGTIKEGLYYPESIYNRFIGLDYEHGQPKILYTILPILVSLPYAGSYCNDWKSGYIQNIVTRIPRKTYNHAKLITVFFSGFIVTFAILIFSFVITSTIFPFLPPEAITATFPAAYENSMMLEVFLYHPFLYTVFYILIDSCFMGLIALMSLSVGLFTTNLYISVTAGTIIFYAISYIFSVFQLNTLNPYVFLMPSQPYQGILFRHIVIEFVVALFVSLMIFYIKERKKDVLSV